jgi:hypothetical protein
MGSAELATKRFARRTVIPNKQIRLKKRIAEVYSVRILGNSLEQVAGA